MYDTWSGVDEWSHSMEFSHLGDILERSRKAYIHIQSSKDANMEW